MQVDKKNVEKFSSQRKILCYHAPLSLLTRKSSDASATAPLYGAASLAWQAFFLT
jgi:hypothetical protein